MPRDISTKNYWKYKKRLCVRWLGVINFTWEDLQIAKHKSVRWTERTPSWFKPIKFSFLSAPTKIRQAFGWTSNQCQGISTRKKKKLEKNSACAKTYDNCKFPQVRVAIGQQNSENCTEKLIITVAKPHDKNDKADKNDCKDAKKLTKIFPQISFRANCILDAFHCIATEYLSKSNKKSNNDQENINVEKHIKESCVHEPAERPDRQRDRNRLHSSSRRFRLVATEEGSSCYRSPRVKDDVEESSSPILLRFESTWIYKEKKRSWEASFCPGQSHSFSTVCKLLKGSSNCKTLLKCYLPELECQTIGN